MTAPAISQWRSVLPTDLSRLPGLRHDLSGWLDAQDVRRGVAAAVVLCVHEAAANAVEHAFPDGRSGSVVVQVQATGDRVTVQVVDDGRWKPSGPSPGRGLGLRLLQTLMDDVVVTSTTDGTAVTMYVSTRSTPPRRPVPAAGTRSRRPDAP